MNEQNLLIINQQSDPYVAYCCNSKRKDLILDIIFLFIFLLYLFFTFDNTIFLLHFASKNLLSQRHSQFNLTQQACKIVNKHIKVCPRIQFRRGKKNIFCFSENFTITLTRSVLEIIFSC